MHAWPGARRCIFFLQQMRRGNCYHHATYLYQVLQLRHQSWIPQTTGCNHNFMLMLCEHTIYARIFSQNKRSCCNCMNSSGLDNSRFLHFIRSPLAVVMLFVVQYSTNMRTQYFLTGNHPIYNKSKKLMIAFKCTIMKDLFYSICSTVEP
jgi:hypothetical protein